MKSRISSIVPLLLITLVCIGLVEGGYQIVERFIIDEAALQTEVSVVETPPKQSVTRSTEAKKNDYRIILQRNLFGSPPGGQAAGPPADTDPARNLEATSLAIVLMGTITGSEGTARAFILDSKIQKQNVYEIGDEVQGALVKEILRGKVILSYAGKDEILDMSEAAKVRPAARVAPAPVSKSTTPVRVVPKPAGGVAPASPAAEMSAPAPAANANRARRIFVPQRVYRPSQPAQKQ